ncbi:MAG: L-threonylcarbamoyladenylate synthase [Hyphomicrobiaceae bacterium]
MGVQPASFSTTNREIDAAAARIRDGHLVAFPTETVYGLGADATNGEAVARIYETKQRPHFNPLIVHVSDRNAADRLVRFNDAASRLAGAFWPGPLTLILPAKENNGISSLVTAGLDTLAIRVPEHPVARALLETAGRPVAAPSANRSGRVSPTSAAHVADEFQDTGIMVLDGGSSRSGLESTIVDLAGKHPAILRPGTITREEVEHVIGQPAQPAPIPSPSAPTAPGQLASHYAPTATIRLNACRANPGEALIGFGPDAPAAGDMVVNLSPTGDLREAAANLFDTLRTLDQQAPGTIAVMPIPDTGIGVAINDRLKRAAAPRA